MLVFTGSFVTWSVKLVAVMSPVVRAGEWAAPYKLPVVEAAVDPAVVESAAVVVGAAVVVTSPIHIHCNIYCYANIFLFCH